MRLALGWILILALALPAIALGKGAVDGLEPGLVTTFFAAMRIGTDGLRLTRAADDGTRYQLQIGDKPAVPSAPGSVATVPFGAPFRLFANECGIDFLPIFRDRGVTDMWLVEPYNRRGNVHVGLVGTTSGRTVGSLTLGIRTWTELKAFENDVESARVFQKNPK
jgi:hypothetical protein